MGSQAEPELAGGTPLRAITKWLGAAGPRRRGQRLPSLAAAHPGIPSSGRWIGLRAVPTRCIRGTASRTIPASRGVDFRPVEGREPSDWRSRWTRLEAAVANQAVLPPVDLIRAGGEYWVVDGHNRVALAKQRGQLWIDADITELDIIEPDTTEPGAGPDRLAVKAA